MDYLEEGLQYGFSLPVELEFRREPHVNPQMDDGKDNIIFSLPKGAVLILEVIEVRVTDEEEWYNVQLIIEDQDITGWVDGSSLLDRSLESPETGIIPVTGGAQGALASYVFPFAGSTYCISEENLSNARGKYLELEPKPNFKAVSINGGQYFTSPENMNNMTDVGWVRKLR